MVRVTQPADINAVALLAKEIWEEHYVPLLGQEQVDYMLDKFQSAPAIAQQIANGYEYYCVMEEEHRSGYFAIVFHPQTFHAQLSKIYVRQAQRGRGIAKAIMLFVGARCVERGVHELWLTVNRHNTGSIACYRKLGFTQSGSIVQHIGNGFVMDDYKMEKRIGRSSPATSSPPAALI
ncbi:MAG: GNAT family N-acetyltransferase [bacterium]